MKQDKAYYCKLYFNQILPQIIEITTQSKYGYHGLSHTNQVALFGIDLAYSINQDILPVILAAGLHDCARTNDEWALNTDHGRFWWGVIFYQKTIKIYQNQQFDKFYMRLKITQLDALRPMVYLRVYGTRTEYACRGNMDLDQNSLIPRVAMTLRDWALMDNANISKNRMHF